jgi:hypothetical protein
MYIHQIQASATATWYFYSLLRCQLEPARRVQQANKILTSNTGKGNTWEVMNQVSTFCTTSFNGAEGKDKDSTWWNRLPAIHSSTNCNRQNRDKYCMHSGFITHKISNYFAEPLVQISSKKLQVNSAHIRCKPGLSFTFINSTKQLV